MLKVKVRRGCTVPRPLTWPSTKKSEGTEKIAMTAQWMVAESCLRPSLSGLACAWTPHGFYLQEVSFPLWELPERGQSLTSNRL